MSTDRYMPSIYPYRRHCPICNTWWTVTEANKVKHEETIAEHRAAHKKEVKR